MKYTIHSTKSDWNNLYKEFQILNNVYNANFNIKKIKKSTSFDTMWTLLQLVKKKYNLD